MTQQIQLKRRLAATPDEVYRAWTDGALLSQWMVPIVGGRTVAHADARVGGALTIEMYGLGSQYPQPAQYLRLERPRLVEFSWVTDPAAPQRSIVTVELAPVGDDETELTLTHRLLPDEASAQSHAIGWDAGLDSLLAHINRADRRHFRKELHLKAPASALYAALSTENGLRSWWTHSCTVGSAVGDQARFAFGDNHKLMRIETLRPERQVRWLCLESVIHAPGRRLRDNEWAGSHIVFRINGDTPTHTVLRFEHLGLTPALDCFDLCENGWTHFLGSLQQYVETGRGQPYQDDATHATGGPSSPTASRSVR